MQDNKELMKAENVGSKSWILSPKRAQNDLPESVGQPDRLALAPQNDIWECHCELKERSNPADRKEFLVDDSSFLLPAGCKGSKPGTSFVSLYSEAKPSVEVGATRRMRVKTNAPLTRISSFRSAQAEIQPSPTRGEGKSVAFTLAEVLITLGIIGVVAAITSPALITNVQSRIRAEQTRTAKYKFTKATDEMKSLDLIGPYDSTEAFINELKKHLKIAKVCPPGKLEGCRPTTEVTIDNDGNTLEISKVTTGRQFKMPSNADSDYTSDNIGIVTADGTPMIISYNKKCKPLEPEKTYSWATEDNKPVSNATAGCVAAVMDINGSKKPNKLSEDVVLFNAMGLGSGCGMEISGRCFSAPIASYRPLTYTECEAQKGALGIPNCLPAAYGDDYWAGAVAQCGHISKMATVSDLALIASALYGASISGNTAYTGPFNVNLASKYGLPNPGTSYFYIWANQQNTNINSYLRGFSGNYTSFAYGNRFSAYITVCVSD